MLKIILHNEQHELDRMQKAVTGFSEKYHFPQKIMNGLQLALEELFNNAVLYGFGKEKQRTIMIVLRMTGKTLAGEISDDGRPFDPTRYPEPDLDLEPEDRRVGGLGIHLARTFFDEWNYKRVNHRNILTFKKQIRDQ